MWKMYYMYVRWECGKTEKWAAYADGEQAGTHHLSGRAVADLVHLQLLLGGERHAAGLTHQADRAELRPGRQTGLLTGQTLLQRPH